MYSVYGGGVCDVFEARERIVRGGAIIPREQRRTGEGAESSSGRGHCSRDQSRPGNGQHGVARRAPLMGGLALAMLVSISEGFCLEGLLGAILFKEADMLAAGVESWSVEG